MRAPARGEGSDRRPGQRVVSRRRASSRSPALVRAPVRAGPAAGPRPGPGPARAPGSPARRGRCARPRRPRAHPGRRRSGPAGRDRAGLRLSAAWRPRPAPDGGRERSWSGNDKVRASLPPPVHPARLIGVVQATAGLLARGSTPRSAFPGGHRPVAPRSGSPPTVAGAAPDLGRNPYRLPFQVPKDTVASSGNMVPCGGQAIRPAGASHQRQLIEPRTEPLAKHPLPLGRDRHRAGAGKPPCPTLREAVRAKDRTQGAGQMRAPLAPVQAGPAQHAPRTGRCAAPASAPCRDRARPGRRGRPRSPRPRRRSARHDPAPPARRPGPPPAGLPDGRSRCVPAAAPRHVARPSAATGRGPARPLPA